jgi:hypothetical protein
MKQRGITWIREGECIRCTSHGLDNGYPKIHRNGRARKIARLILIRRIGDIPSNVVSRHTCDNRWCIRPDHIIAGTRADNNRDRAERAGYSITARKGEDCAWSKLTSIQVRQIRESIEPQRKLAKRFGVSQAHVWRIKKRGTWAHL